MTPATTAHPSAEKLNAFVLGRLDDPASAEIESHLEVCEACQRLAENTPDDSLVETLQEPAPAAAESAESQPGLFARLAAIVNPQARKPAPRPASRSHQDVPAALRDHPRYEVLERLGAGGMGTVFKARHRLMDRVVALKVMNPSLLADRAAVGRFQREVKAAAQLAHPHIVTAYDAEQLGDVHFLAMEYVEGQTLAEIVDLRGPLPVHRACEYVRQAAIGLQYASQRGMVHRDIKPQNLVLTETGEVKVFDFGLARFVSESGEPGEGSSSGRMLGSPDYMAPEQAKDAHRADIRADIYSLGCTLYHLLTGLPPFAGGTPIEKLAAHLEKTPIEVAKLRLDISADVERVVERMLAKDPQQRFQTPGEVAAALEPFCKPGPAVASAAQAAPTVRPQRRRARLIAATALLLFLGVTGVFFTGPIYRIVTDQGTLLIQTEDLDVKVVVKQGGKQITIVDTKTRREVTLKAGEYQIELAPGKQGLKLSTTQFRLTRGSKQIARVWVGPKPGAQVVGEDAHPKTTPAEPSVPTEPASEPPSSGAPPLVAPFQIWEVRALIGHRQAVISVAFSPDGRYVLSGSLDRTVRLWEVGSGEEVRRYDGASNLVHYVAFSPDGSRVVAADTSGFILLWDSATARLIHRFEAHKGCTLGVAFSPDGRSLVSGGLDATVRLWDAESGRVLKTFSGHQDQVRSVAFSPDGRQIVSGSWDKTVRLWDVETGRRLRLFEGHTQPVLSVAFLPSGNGVLSASGDRTVRLWDVETGVATGALVSREFAADRARGSEKTPLMSAWDSPGHPTAIWGLAVSQDGHRALSGSGHALTADGDYSTSGSDYRVRLYSVATGQEIGRYEGPTDRVTSLAFSPDGRLAVSGGYDKTVRILWLAEPDKAPAASPARKLAQLALQENSPSLPVIVKQGGRLVTVLQSKFSRSAPLAPGDYELELAGQPEEFRLAAEKITLKESRTQTVVIERVPLAEKPPVPEISQIKRFDGHTYYVERAVFSPDGRQILSCSRDKTVRAWDVAGGGQTGRFTGHSEYVFGLAVSPDGRLAVSAGGGDHKDGKFVATDFKIRLWDVATGKEIRTFAGHTHWISSLAVSPDGRYVLSGSVDQTIRLWDVNTGGELRRFEGHEGAVNHVAFSPDARRILSGGTDGLVRLWDVDTGQELRRFEGHTDFVAGVGFSPDGRLVLSGSFDKTMRLWDAETGQQLRCLTHPSRVSGVAFSPDGRRVLSASGDRIGSSVIDCCVRLWDVASGRALGRFEGHTDAVIGVAFSADGRQALSNGWDNSVRLLKLPDAPSLPITEVRRFSGHTGPVEQVALSTDGRQALSCSQDQTLRLWNVQTGEQIRQFEGEGAKDMARRVALSPDGKLAASSCHCLCEGNQLFFPTDYSIRLWDVGTGREKLRFLGHTKPVYGLAFTPDGRRVLSASDDTTLRVWDVQSGRLVRVIQGHDGAIGCLDIFADGRHVVSGAWDNTIRLWDVATGRELRRLEGHTNGIHSVSISPDGRRALSCGFDGTMRLWDLTTGRQLRLFPGHRGTVTQVAFSPDGRLAVSGCDDAIVRLWDVARGVELGRFEGLTDFRIGLAFAPDGQSVLACSGDATIRLLKLPEVGDNPKAVLPGDTGQLVLESKASDGWLLVKQREKVVLVLDATANQEADLKSGEYRLELAGRTEGLRLSVDNFTLPKGGKQVVQIRPQSQPARVEITEVRSLVGHRSAVLGTAVLRDGRHVLTGGLDMTVRLWDLVSGTELRRFEGHTRGVQCVAVSHDGRFALSAGGGHWFEGRSAGDLDIRLWDIAAGRELRRFQGHTDYILSVAFSPDGRFALSGSVDRTMRLWDVATGKQIHSLRHPATVASVAFSPEARCALAGVWDGTARVWDLGTGTEVRHIDGHGAGLMSAAFSPDGRQLLTGSVDRTVRVWDRETGTLLRSFPHPTGVLSVAFSPDGKRLLSSSGARVLHNNGFRPADYDYVLRLWDVASGQEIGRLEGLPGGAGSLAFSADGRFGVASGQFVTCAATSNHVRLFWFSETEKPDTRTSDEGIGQLAVETNGFDLPVIVKQPDKLVTVIVPKISKQAELPPGDYQLELAGQPDDFTLSANQVSLAKNAKQTVSIREVPPVQPPHEITELRRFDGHTGSVESVAFSKDGRQILSGAKDKTIRLWDAETGKEIRQFEGNTQAVFSVALSPDGRRALSAGSDQASGDFAIRLWDVESGKEIRRFSGHSDGIWSVAFSPDGKRAVSGSADGSARLWDVSTGEQIREFTGHESDVRCVNFSPDGNRLLSASDDGTVRVWDAATGKVLRCLEGHTHMAIWAAFSPDGHQAVSCGYDWTVRLWDLDTGRQIRAFPRTPSCVVRVTYSPDGRRILGGSGWRIGGGAGHDNCVRLWDVDTGVELARFEGHTGPLLAVAFSPDGRRAVSSAYDHTIRLLQLPE